MSLPLLLQLPQDALEHIAFHLQAPDLLSFLSSHRFLHEALGNKAAFWRNLLWQREGSSSSSSSSPFICNHDDMQEEDNNNAKELKEQFIRAAYCQRLSNVQWRSVAATRSSPSEREGHGCCLLGEDNNLLVVTGGFTNDRRIYIKDLNDTSFSNSRDGWHQVNPTVQYIPDHTQQPPPNLFAYGASLTRLNATTAVRFGGFTSGGYAHETSLVAVLTITTCSANNDNIDDDDGSPTTTNDRFKATWRLVPQKFTATNDNEKMELQAPRFGSLMLARAYHTATLLDNRYLYIVGGIKSSSPPGRSVLDPICLDCETWTWMILFHGQYLNIRNHDGVFSFVASLTPAEEDGTIIATPSGRHGHSIVWDKYRDRLVLFGGGNGSDLLRSGRDNSEVWEFKNITTAAATATAAPSSSSSTTTTPSPESFLAKIKSCQWRLIHQDQNHYSSSSSNSTPTDNTTTNASNTAPTSSSSFNNNRLRPAETLNLGRCHAAHQVSRDTVILLFGSGKPSTNSILAYNLQTDSFFRPKLVATAAPPSASNFILPCPRFTFASVFIPRLGCIFVHGGYSTQYSQSIVDMVLLNLTPAATAASQLVDDNARQAAFGRSPQYVRSHVPVTDQHVLALHTGDRHQRRHPRAPLFHAVHQVMRLQRPLFFPDQDFDSNEDGSDDDEDDSS